MWKSERCTGVRATKIFSIHVLISEFQGSVKPLIWIHLLLFLVVSSVRSVFHESLHDKSVLFEFLAHSLVHCFAYHFVCLVFFSRKHIIVVLLFCFCVCDLSTNDRRCSRTIIKRNALSFFTFDFVVVWFRVERLLCACVISFIHLLTILLGMYYFIFYYLPFILQYATFTGEQLAADNNTVFGLARIIAQCTSI